MERYARVLPAVEINSSFYRPHRPGTYARWRDSVPETFRFAVKVPKVITHELRLRDAREPLERFLGEAGHLEAKLGCLLVQLPPSLQHERETARAFFQSLRERTAVDVVCEPRHRTWFTDEARQVLDCTPAGATRQGLEKARAWPRDTSPSSAARTLGSGQKVLAEDTVPFAVWCAARHLDSFEEALWCTVAGFGDRDTTCAMAGGIVALSAGRSSIPAKWLSAREPLRRRV
nr:DUF72 domain-containing protein [Corallococcus exiguus]